MRDSWGPEAGVYARTRAADATPAGHSPAARPFRADSNALVRRESDENAPSAVHGARRTLSVVFEQPLARVRSRDFSALVTVSRHRSLTATQERT
jgi:hypothetical protein